MSHTIDGLLAPLRHAIRALAATPGTSAVAIGTMAAAIGANAAVFSVANGTILRPLPFRDPARLVLISAEFPRMKLTGMGLSGPEAIEFAELAHGFASSGAVLFDTATVAGRTEPIRARVAYASAGALDTLGTGAMLGRTYSADEDRPGGPRVAVLGHALWVRAFGADPGVLGRGVTIDGVSATVIGVMPESFDLLGSATELWLPLRLDRASGGSRADHRYRVIARIAPGTSVDEARRGMDAAVTVWREETGQMHAPDPRMHPLALTSLLDASVGSVRGTMGLMLGAVGFVLVMACANVSNLLLSRAERRRHEIAVRVALGATRARLLRDHVLEGLCLAAAGSLIGLLVTQLLLAIVLAGPVTLPRAAEVRVDFTVLLFTLVLTGLTGVAFGLAPVLRIDAARAVEWLKGDSRGSVGSRERHRLQRALVAVEIALALMLLAGAGVMLRGFWRLAHVDPGFDPTGVVAMTVSLPTRPYVSDEQVWGFYEQLVQRIRAAGAGEAGVLSGELPQRRANNTTFLLDGMAVMSHETMPQVDFIQHVTEGSLPALGAQVLAGRMLTAADSDTSAPVAIVNESLARKFWPGASALGHRLRVAGKNTPWVTVVGVVRDLRQAGLHAAPGTEIYITHRQAKLLLPDFVPRDMTVVARVSAGRVQELSRALPGIVRAMDPGLAVARVSTMTDTVARSIAQPRAIATVLAGFAVSAVLLAAIGIYGVISFAVGQRASEFAVRMALGASAASIVRLVLAQSSWPVAAGIAMGLAGAGATTRVLSSQLFDIAPTDPPTFGAVAVLLAAVALAACSVPARRATRVDPIEALKNV